MHDFHSVPIKYRVQKREIQWQNENEKKTNRLLFIPMCLGSSPSRDLSGRVCCPPHRDHVFNLTEMTRLVWFWQVLCASFQHSRALPWKNVDSTLIVRRKALRGHCLLLSFRSPHLTQVRVTIYIWWKDALPGSLHARINFLASHYTSPLYLKSADGLFVAFQRTLHSCPYADRDYTLPPAVFGSSSPHLAMCEQSAGTISPAWIALDNTL